ncbi:MAG: metal-dependent hydrolase, partial [Gammaproteobacteria bacterium]
FVSLSNGIFYGALEPIQPIGLRIATVAAIEHVNAFMAHIVLSKDIFRNAQKDVRRLFYWHFSEEIEHKCVAHDFLVRDHPSYLLRVFGGLIGFSAFFLASFAGMCFLLAQRKRLFAWKTLAELKAFWIDAGVLKETLHHLAEYFAPNFHPRNLSDFSLVEQVRGKLLKEC